ncbi:hypothetical protein G6F23_013399 [Rhizopus arrhizus]|nr:hypothetical protein G6F23_013399 [Rhizopus arrhizus]
MVGSGGKRLCFAGHVHQAGLQHRRQRAHGADSDDHRADRPPRLCRQRIQQQHHDRPQQHHGGGLEVELVHQPATGDVADDRADAEHAHRQRHPRFGHAGDLHQGRCQVGEHTEHTGETDRTDRQRQPHLGGVEGAQFAHRRGTHLVRIGQQEARDHHHGGDGQQADQGEGGAPAQLLAQPGGQRIADQDRDRQAEQHARHRLATLAGGADRRSHQHRHAEFGASALARLPTA